MGSPIIFPEEWSGRLCPGLRVVNRDTGVVVCFRVGEVVAGIGTIGDFGDVRDDPSVLSAIDCKEAMISRASAKSASVMNSSSSKAFLKAWDARLLAALKSFPQSHLKMQNSR